MVAAYFFDAEGQDREDELSAARLAEVQDQRHLRIDLVRTDASGVSTVAAILDLPDESIAAIKAVAARNYSKATRAISNSAFRWRPDPTASARGWIIWTQHSYY